MRLEKKKKQGCRTAKLIHKRYDPLQSNPVSPGGTVKYFYDAEFRFIVHACPGALSLQKRYSNRLSSHSTDRRVKDETFTCLSVP